MTDLDILRLNCEHLVVPLGLDERGPRLDWQPSGNRCGLPHTRYWKMVAGSPDELARGGVGLRSSGWKYSTLATLNSDPMRGETRDCRRTLAAGRPDRRDDADISFEMGVTDRWKNRLVPRHDLSVRNLHGFADERRVESAGNALPPDREQDGGFIPSGGPVTIPTRKCCCRDRRLVASSRSGPMRRLPFVKARLRAR